jgi:hypothetical protein
LIGALALAAGFLVGCETNSAALVNDDGWKIDGLSGIGGADSSGDTTDSTTG